MGLLPQLAPQVVTEFLSVHAIKIQLHNFIIFLVMLFCAVSLTPSNQRTCGHWYRFGCSKMQALYLYGSHPVQSLFQTRDGAVFDRAA